MKRKTLVLLTVAISLGLTGCVTLGPRAERETTWAKMGTPARIVDQRKIDVLVPDGKGGWQRSTAVLAGMCVLDEPTLDYYRGLDAEKVRREPKPPVSSTSLRVVESGVDVAIGQQAKNP
jgi:hypothetical protein